MNRSNAAFSRLSGLSSVSGPWQVLFWASVYLIVAAILQFHFVSVPYDADTAYHVAVGRLIRDHGILHAFPWTPFSWLAGHYADKELLLHLLFSPLSSLDWITASRIIGTLLGAIILFVLYVILRAEKVRFAGIWALLPLITSDVFVFRFALVRPHLMSIALSLLVIWAAMRGRFVILAISSALYPWAYVAFWQIPLILLFIVEVARFLSGRAVQWKPAAIAFAGILLGWALHPNSMNLLKFNWIQMVDVLLKKAWQHQEGIELGIEFLPFTAGQWAQWLLACTSMGIVGLVMGWLERKHDTGLLAFALAAAAFGLLTLRTARFAEYFIPFSAVTMALAARSIPWRGITIAVFATCLLYTGTAISETLQGLSTRPDILPQSRALWFKQQILPGSQIFTTEWGLTGRLMLALPDSKFIVALDPTLFLVKDPELYRLWYDLPRNPRPGMAEIMRRRFGARYVISFGDERFEKFYYMLANEPGVTTLLISELWMVYDLGGPTGRSVGQ